MKHIAYYCLAAASMLAGLASAQVRPGPAPASAAAPAASSAAASGAAPVPLAAQGQPADWVFAFKFNTATAPTAKDAVRDCLFGGQPQPYAQFGQQYALATSAAPQLKAGPGLIGTSLGDPVGATFSQIYNGPYNFVVWNDQFYDAPKIAGCVKSCSGPWGHSKGVLAWNDAGEGVIMQVSTPSWPASGSAAAARQGDGNTLGCVEDDDVEVSQHFFALRLSETDVEHVLDALANASVVTDVTNPMLARSGGPAAIRQRLALLGRKSTSTTALSMTLSSGVRLISKPSQLRVPPWQMISSLLGGASLRTATWWTAPAIASTTAATAVACWDASLPTKPGAVDIATSGSWAGKPIGLTGGAMPSGNHAKIAVTTSGDKTYAIFGDMNQQGSLSGPKCQSSQNGRGGLFFAVQDPALHASVQALLKGNSGPVAP
jgi:hypothetical protein